MGANDVEQTIRDHCLTLLLQSLQMLQSLEVAQSGSPELYHTNDPGLNHQLLK
jgi:hypothetical protein